MTKKIEIKVKRADKCEEQILGLAQTFDPRQRPIPNRVTLKIKKGSNQLAFSFLAVAWADFLGLSPVGVSPLPSLLSTLTAVMRY